MNWIERAKQRGVAGFSLLELMVVVAILGVLAMVAVPRYNIFRARSRQAEAKSNLGVIFTLQESFQIEHERYYNGDGTQWGGATMNTILTRQGYRGGATTTTSGRTCERNKLGFRLANCDSARYGYHVAGADEDEYVVIAYGASDVAGDERIFPGCNGTDATARDATAATYTRPVAVRDLACNTVADTADPAGIAVASTMANIGTQSSFTTGDAWCLDEGRRVENYRDIVEFCDD